MRIWLFGRKEEGEEKKPKAKVQYELSGWRKTLFYFGLIITGFVILNFIFLGFGRAGALSYQWFKFVNSIIWFFFVSGFAWILVGFGFGFVVPKPIFEYQLENGKTGWRLVTKDPEEGTNYVFHSFRGWRKPIVINKDYVRVARQAFVFTKYMTIKPMIVSEEKDRIILTCSDLLTEKTELDELRIRQLTEENVLMRKKVQELIKQITLLREQEPIRVMGK